MANPTQFTKLNDGDVPSCDYFGDLAGEILHQLALTKLSAATTEFVSDSTPTAGASSSYNFASGGITYLAHGYDEFNAALDTTKWTNSSTGAATVTANPGLKLTTTNSTIANNSIATQKTSGLDFRTLSGDAYLEFTASTPSYDDGSFLHSCQGSIKVGATTIVTQSDSHSGGGGAATLPNLGGVWRFFFNKSGLTVRCFKDAAEVAGSPFNISAEATWYLVFQFTTGNSTTTNGSTWTISYFRYIGAGGAALNYISGTNAISAGKTFATVFSSNTLNQCTLASLNLSIDGGSTYTVANTTKTIFSITSTTGTSLVSKVVFTPPASITPSAAYSPFPGIDYWYSWVFS